MKNDPLNQRSSWVLTKTREKKTAHFLVLPTAVSSPEAPACFLPAGLFTPDRTVRRARETEEKRRSTIAGEGNDIVFRELKVMDSFLGLLRVRIIRGVNLAFRDTRGSDPYIVLRLGRQKLKTSVKKKNVNPEWNEDLTLSVSEPLAPIKLQVYDKDTFSRDDEMGDAEFEIEPFIEAVKMDLSGIPNGTIITTAKPCRQNCLAGESAIVWKDGKVIQDIVLRLRNVESGEVELQLVWVNIPSAPGF